MADEAKVTVGQRVIIQGKLNLGPGTVRYVGLATFQTGRWVGIELDAALGKNDGEVQGERYFDCKPAHGLFVKPAQVIPISADGTPIEQPTEEAKPKAAASSPSTPRGTSSSPSTPRTTSLVKKATTTKTASTTDPTKKVAAKTGTTKTTTTKSPTTTSKLGATTKTSTTSTTKKTTTKSTSPKTTTTKAAGEKKATPPTASPLSKPLDTSSDSAIEAADAEEPEKDDKDDEEDEGELLAGDYEDSGDEGETEEHKDEEEEPQSAPASTSKAPEPVVLATPPSIDLNSIKSDSVDRMMQALKELNEFKINAQETIHKLQQNCSELTTQKEKMVKEHEKEKQRLTKELEKEVKQQGKQGAKDEKSNAAWEKEKQDLQAQIASANDNLETLTLDKEIAEQTVEELESQLAGLKEELERVKTELEELQTDIAIKEEERKTRAEMLKETGEGGADNEQLLELMEQNDKLKEALVKLRDVALSDKQESTKRAKELEKAAKSIETLQEKLTKAEEELKSRAEKIEELIQRVDDASEAQDMVEELSEKNGQLEEQIAELTQTVEDMETMKDLADELEENHQESERQLRREINQKDIDLINREGTITNLHLKVVDQDATIAQFRDKVTKLQGQIENMRRREEEESLQRNEIANRERSLMSQNIQLQSKMLKVVAMEVDQQIERMKANESALQYQFTKAFLPELGFQIDNESLRVVLAAKRIGAKANIINTQLHKLHPHEAILAQFQSTNTDETMVPDTVIHALKVEELLTTLANVAADFEDTIGQCDVELYVKIGKLVYDIEPCEKTLDMLLALVRDEEFGPGYIVNDLEKTVQKLELLSTASLGKYVVRPVWRAIQYETAKAMYSTLLLFMESVKHGKPASEEVSSARVSSIVDYSKKLISALGPQSKLRRSTIVIDSLSLSNQRSHTILQLFAQATAGDYESSLAKLSEILDQNLKTAFGQTIQPEEEDLSARDELDRYLAVIRNNLRDVYDSVVAGDLDFSAAEKEAMVPPVSPWTVRGQQMQEQLSEVGTLRETLSQKEKQAVELQKTIKIKEQEVQDEKWKVESLDRLAKNAKKVEEEYVAKVAAEVEKSKKQEKVYEQALESMRQDAAKLEQELSDLRRKNIGLEKGARTATSMNLLSGLTEKISGSVSVSNSELEALRSAIKFLRNENATLKAEQAANTLATGLPELPTTTHRRLYGPAQVQPQVNDVIKYGNEVSDFMKETYQKLASAKVIQLQPKPTTPAPTQQQQQSQTTPPTKTTETKTKFHAQTPAPVELLQLKTVEMATLAHKGTELKEKMAKLVSGETPAAFAQFATPSTTKALKDAYQPTLMGKVLFPSVPSLQTGKPISSLPQQPPRIIFNKLADFAQLHSVFVQ